MENIILDVDTGLDDAITIIFSSLQTEFNIAGITTANGNRPLNQVVENTLRVVEALGRKISVYRGSALPLNAYKNRKTGFPYADDDAIAMHGTLLNIPQANIKPEPELAISWLHRYLRNNELTTIVATAPLTNIAQLFLIDPNIKNKIKRLVILGGGRDIGNVTHYAEFNFWADPEAAKIVLNSGVKIHLITLNEANLAVFDSVKLEKMLDGNQDSPESKLIKRILEKPLSEENSHVTLYDMLTIAYLSDPRIMQFEPMELDINIEVDGNAKDGQLLYKKNKTSNCFVSVGIDIDRLWKYMKNALAR